MLRLKIKELRENRDLTTRQLSVMAGVRWNTVDDMEQNKSKHWSVENLEKIMNALQIADINELIEYVKDEKPTE
jgi:putative transcriptional regulator